MDGPSQQHGTATRLPPLHDKSVIYYAMPGPGWSYQQLLATLSSRYMGNVRERSRVCVYCVYLSASVTERQRVGTCWNRKPRQAFTLEEFPACKMSIAVFLQLSRDGREGEEGGVVSVWRAFQGRFLAAVWMESIECKATVAPSSQGLLWLGARPPMQAFF